MIFRHGEPSSYGLEDADLLPYELRWAWLAGVPSVDSLCEEIVSRFGPVVRMDPGREASLLFARLQKECGAGSARDRLREAESTLRLLLAIYREQQVFSREDPVAFGKQLLENEFRSNRNIKEFVAEIGITREHFTRAFLERYGETPGDFLRRLRLGYAQQLTGTPTLRQKEIAAASGFRSEATFRHAYTREYGHSPGTTEANKEKEQKKYLKTKKI